MSAYPDDFVPDAPTCGGSGTIHVTSPGHACNATHPDGPHAWCADLDCPGCADCESDEERHAATLDRLADGIEMPAGIAELPGAHWTEYLPTSD